MCLACTEMFSTQVWTKKWFKAVLKHLFRGGALICQKYNSQISKNFEKSPKLATKSVRLLKLAEDEFYEKHISAGMREGWLLSSS